jgi:hypothetical protein
MPGAFLLAEHKLAVAVYALVPLYTFAASALHRARVAARNAAGVFATDEWELGMDPETGVDVFRLLLLVNGDHTTAWNGRKRRVLRRLTAAAAPAHDAPADATSSCRLDDVSHRAAVVELRFAEMVLSKYPKAQSCWAHRRWVLTRVLGVGGNMRRGGGGDGGGREDDVNAAVAEAAALTVDAAAVDVAKRGGNNTKKRSATAATLFAEEARVAERAAQQRRLNYAAWAHRRWCARGHGSGIEGNPPSSSSSPSSSLSSSPKSGQQFQGMLSSVELGAELERAATRVRRNVSDYCGLHYRQALMRQSPGSSSGHGGGSDGGCGDEGSWDWAAEAALTAELIQRYPGREALWAHRRFIFSAWGNQAGRHEAQRGSFGDDGGGEGEGTLGAQTLARYAPGMRGVGGAGCVGVHSRGSDALAVQVTSGGGGRESVRGDAHDEGVTGVGQDVVAAAPSPLSFASELRFAAQWSEIWSTVEDGVARDGHRVGRDEGAAVTHHRNLPLQPTWAENPAAEQARLAAGYRVWVLEAARRSLETTMVRQERGGGGGLGEDAAAVTVAAAALAGEQRAALAALGRMWTWAPAAVAGMGESALGGFNGENART